MIRRASNRVPWMTPLAAALVVAGHLAFAQEPAPEGRAAVEGDRAAAAHRVRGVLAWRRAVWTSRAADYERAASELKAAVDGSSAERNFDNYFMLGYSLARLRRTAEAHRAIQEADARKRQPEPGTPTDAMLKLVEAIQQTAEGPAWHPQPLTGSSLRLLDDYVVRIATYKSSSPFAAELRYAGRLERGMRQFAEGLRDPAARDLTQAAESARAEGRPVSLELGRLLVEVHTSLAESPKAREAAERLLRADPGEPTHYSVLGRLTAAGDAEAARRWQERALSFAPNFGEGHAKLAYLAWKRDDTDTMRRHLEAFHSLLRDRWEADPGSRTPQAAANLHAGWGLYWQLRGDLAANAGDAPRAREAWLRAKSAYLESYHSYPGCEKALTRLEKVLRQLREPEAEIEVYTQRLEQLKRKAPGSPEPVGDTFC